MKTSYSALESFKSCPLKYKYQEIDKIRTPKGPEAVFGTLVHSTLNFVHTGNFLLPTEKEALNYFSTNWNADIFPDELSERTAFAQGIKIVQDYYQKNDPNKASIVDLESRFTIELNDPETNENHLISGFIDRIDKTPKGYEIIDYKTSRKMPSQQAIEDNWQLLIYLLAFLKRYPQEEKNLQNIDLSLYFLKHGAKLTTQKTKEQLIQAKEDVLKVIRQIEKSDFPAQVNPLCDWCGYQKNCPMWRHKFKESTTISDQEKQKTIKEYINLTEEAKQTRVKIKELQEKILEIMAQEDAGQLFGEGKIISKTTRKTYKYDEDKLKEILEKENKWQDVLSINAIKLKKLLETLPTKTKNQAEEAREVKESEGLSVRKQ